ncbi:MAG TPA: hypothetical protein VHJ34_03400 [Actinomycetota bacterium]|nr:hypothetical protein [Actinomycetota bacterium]
MTHALEHVAAPSLAPPRAPARPDTTARAGRGPRSSHDFGAVRVVPEPDVAASAHPSLPAGTAAWAEAGTVSLTPGAFLLGDPWRVVRHERAHARSQIAAPPDESLAARARAERDAARAETGTVPAAAPVPRLLAFPPQTHAPWTRVWIGYPGIVGEIVAAGLSVRIFVAYSEIGMTGAAFRDYHCAPADRPALAAIAAKMKDVAARTARLNERIPAAAPQRITLVTVFGDKSNAAYRTANGTGLLTLDRESFDAGTYADTIAHEGAHAIFEYHATAGAAPAPAADAGAATGERPRIPDAVALRVADLFVRLGETRRVPEPTARFDPAAPPSLALAEGDRGRPAGHVMVMDTLWASTPGGHPWENADELFASAYAAWVTDAKLVKAIAAHYAAADPTLKALADELFRVLEAVRAGRTVVPPTAERTAAAESALRSVHAAADFSGKDDVVGWMIDPDRLPSPQRIPCPVPEPAPIDEDELLSPGEPEHDAGTVTPDAGTVTPDAGTVTPERR